MKPAFYFIITAFVLLSLSCQSDVRIIQPSQAVQPTGKMVVSFTTVPAGIIHIIATLTRIGYDSLMLYLPVPDSGQSDSGTFQNVSIGLWHLKVQALDQNNIVQYTGETDVTIRPGETIRADLELEPSTGNLEIHITWGEGNTPDITRGLVAYFPFNGNSNDSSGNGNNGILFGGVLSDSDRFGNPNHAYSFNGIDGYIRVVQSTSLLFYNGISISMWFKPLDFVKLQDPISQWSDNSGSDRGYALSIENYGIVFNILSSDNWLYYSVPNLTTKWYSEVVTWNGSVSTIYLDGVRIASLPTNGTFTNQNISLGIGADLNPIESFFRGSLDDIRIYNRAISSTEVQQLYHEGGW
jgi:hypothetical protein